MHLVQDCSNDSEHLLQVIYDIMVCAVGETTATFGVPGVMEHCYFMKACAQARSLNRSPTPSMHIFSLPMPLPLQPHSELTALTWQGAPRRR